MTTTTPQRPSPRRALSRWARVVPLALALALITGMVAPGGARPAAADGGPTICGTLNTPACPSSPSSPSSPHPLLDDSLLNPVDNGLLKAPDTRFSATAAQITALHALEQEAVADNLTFHGLSTDDANAVSTWGRYDADADLFLLLQQAALTPPISRTQVQSDAVAWLTTVLQRNDVQAEQDAGREYVKWAGLDEVHYNALLSQHADAGTLTNFFTRGTGNPDPANFYTQQDGTQTGYCNYVPPATDTNNNTYSDSSNQTCFVPCQSSAGCIPFGPTTNDFIKWGTVDSTNPDLTNPQYQANAVGVAAGVGLAAVAGVGVGIAGLVGLSVAAGGAAVAAVSASAGLAVSTGALGLIFPFTAAAGGTIVGGAIAGAILVPIIAIVTGAFYAVDLFQSDQVPGNLASVIAAGPPPVDLGAAFQDTQQTAALYSLFIAALAPSASFPAIPDPATPDPFFAVFPKGALTNTTSYTTSISVVDAAAATTTTVRLHETWFVEQVSGSGTTTPVAEQTLRLNYTDWAGKEQTAWLLPPQAGHGYRFLTAQEVPSSGSFNAATCLTDKTCALTDTIDYVGPDGADYSAQVLPALPPIATYTVGASPTEGSPVTFDASSSVSYLGLPLTDQWRFEQVLPPGTTPINLCFFSCGPVDPYAGYTAAVSGARVSYTWPRSGTYGVLLTETDSWGKVTTVTGTVTVADVPPALTLSPAVAVTTGSASTLTGAITHAGSLDTESVTVDWGDGSPTDANVFNNNGPVLIVIGGPPRPYLNPISDTLLGVSDTHTYAAPGVYTATVSVTDQAGATSSATAWEHVFNPQAIAFAPLGARTYGDAPVTVTATGGASGNPVRFRADPPTVCRSSGTNGASIALTGAGICTVTANQAGNALYSAAPPVRQSFTVAQAPLRVTADDKRMTYGGVAPTFTTTENGLVNGDTSSVVHGLRCMAVGANGPVLVNSRTAAGTYRITCAGGVTDNDSYSFTYAAGTLTINPATLTVTADDKRMTYGGAVPALTARYVGFVNGDTNGAVSGGASCATTATSGSPSGGGSAVGHYPITCTAGSLAAANYTFAFRPGTLTVSPAQLTITASNALMTYGSVVPAIAPSYRGFVNGDTANSLPTAPTCSVAATSASPVAGSPYATTCSGAHDPNYTIGYAAGTLIINPAPQAITFGTLPNHLLGDAPVAVGATGGASGNPVTFTASPRSVCTSGGTNGATITPIGVGTCIVTASQAGNGNYQAAPTMARSFTISYPPLSLTLGLMSSPAGPVTTGSVVTVTGTLANHSAAAEAVTLKATLSYVSPSGQRVAISGSSRSFQLAAGQTVGQPFSFTISTYVPRGAYTIALTATDTAGDTASGSAALTVV